MKLYKINERCSMLIVDFSFLYASIGSCLSYGHSCWGAHGKRSSNVDRIESEQQPADQRWAMFKLMQDEVRHSDQNFWKINQLMN